MGLLQSLTNEAAGHKAELAGLGVLAAPSIDEAQAHLRARVAGDYNKAGVEQRTLLPRAAKPVSEIAGLGILAGPSAAHLLKHATPVPGARAGNDMVNLLRSEVQKANRHQAIMGHVKTYGTLGALGAGLGAISGASREKAPGETTWGNAARGAIGTGIGVPATVGMLQLGANHFMKKAAGTTTAAGVLFAFVDELGKIAKAVTA